MEGCNSVRQLKIEIPFSDHSFLEKIKKSISSDVEMYSVQYGLQLKKFA